LDALYLEAIPFPAFSKPQGWRIGKQIPRIRSRLCPVSTGCGAAATHPSPHLGPTLVIGLMIKSLWWLLRPVSTWLLMVERAASQPQAP
jgi:hypothetical protein